MKAGIFYHSHYGNTAYIVRYFREILEKRIPTEVHELHYRGGKKNIITRIFYRLFPGLVRLEYVPIDLKEYDVIFLGIAVMAGHPSSAMAKFLNLCRNIAQKKVICCYVFSIEASMKSCEQYVVDILKSKGVSSIIPVFIPWSKVLDKQSLDKLVADISEKIFEVKQA